MKSTLINDYYLHCHEAYFLTHGNLRNKIKDNNEIHFHNTKRLRGRRLYNGILRTIGDILLVISLLVICKFAGIYEIWLQIAEKLV